MTYTVAAGGTYTYACEFTDGTFVIGEFEATEPAPNTTPTFYADHADVDWTQVTRIKYAPGTLTTAAEFKGAAGLRVLYETNPNYRPATLTGDYSFCVIYADGTTEVVNGTF